MEVHVACVQYELKDLENAAEFDRQVRQYVAEAMQQKPDIIVFPELISVQLATLHQLSSYDAVRELEQYTEQYLHLFSQLSEANQVHIIGGTHIMQRTKGSYVNRAFLFYPDGSHDYCDKIQLTPWEKVVWELEAGNELKTFSTQFGRIAILTCYDIEFPELSRLVAEEGVTIIFSPSSTASEQGLYRVIRCAQARAVENQLFVVQTGTTGSLFKLRDMQFNFTKAGLYSPCDAPFPVGGVIAEGELNREMILFGKLNITALNQIRVSSYAPILKDIRKDMYTVHYLKKDIP